LALVTIAFYRHLPRFTDVPDTLYFIDNSWRFDLLVKARQHIWLGKDVLFTYGPLFQLCFVPIFWMRDLSLGEFFKVWFVVSVCVTIALTYGAGRLLLTQVEPWKRALYLLLLIIFWVQFDIKRCLPLFVFAVFLWIQERVPQSNWRMPLFALLSALLITSSFLIAADAGFYALAAFFLVASCYNGYRFLQRGVWLPGVVFSGLTVTVVFVCVLIVNALFGKVWDFRYWTSCYKLASNYRWFESMPMEPQAIPVLLITVVICFSVFLWTWIVCRRSSQELGLPPRIIAVTLFSLLILQSCVVRSSLENATGVLFTMIAFAGAFLFGPLSRQLARSTARVPVLLALGCTALFAASPYQAFSPVKWWAVWRTPAPLTCPPAKLLLDQACLSVYDFLQLDAGSKFLGQHAGASESVMIFPYENIYGDVARRRVAGGFVQSYITEDPFLLEQHLRGLDRDHPDWAIYSVDTPGDWRLGSWPIDGISNFTRSPEVWLYLHRHFHRMANLELGLLGLQRDEDRTQRWRLEERAWSVPTVHQKVAEGKNILVAGLNSLPQENLDFLKLRIKAHYPFWWRVLKPASMTFFLQGADGKIKAVPALASPNQTYEIWIYPWDESQLMNYFFENQSDWRKPGTRPLIANISVRFDRKDWLSVVPLEFEVQSVEAVHVSLR